MSNKTIGKLIEGKRFKLLEVGVIQPSGRTYSLNCLEEMMGCINEGKIPIVRSIHLPPFSGSTDDFMRHGVSSSTIVGFVTNAVVENGCLFVEVITYVQEACHELCDAHENALFPVGTIRHINDDGSADSMRLFLVGIHQMSDSQSPSENGWNRISSFPADDKQYIFGKWRGEIVYDCEGKLAGMIDPVWVQGISHSDKYHEKYGQRGVEHSSNHLHMPMYWAHIPTPPEMPESHVIIRFPSEKVSK